MTTANRPYSVGPADCRCACTQLTTVHSHGARHGHLSPPPTRIPLHNEHYWPKFRSFAWPGALKFGRFLVAGAGVATGCCSLHRRRRSSPPDPIHLDPSIHSTLPAGAHGVHFHAPVGLIDSIHRCCTTKFTWFLATDRLGPWLSTLHLPGLHLGLARRPC